MHKNILLYRVSCGDYFDVFCCMQIWSFQFILVGFLPKISKCSDYTFFTNITANQHLGAVNPNLIYALHILLNTTIMEQTQAATYKIYK